MVKELIRANPCDDVSSANGFFGCELPQKDSARICEMDEDRFTQLYANFCGLTEKRASASLSNNQTIDL